MRFQSFGVGTRLYAFVALACAAVACGESSTGGDDDGDGGTGGTATGTPTGQGGSGNSDNCASEVLSSLDEDCEGIGSAQMLLDLGAAEQTGTMTWAANSGSELTHSPSTGTTEVTLKLSHDGGELRCNHTCDPCPGMPCGAPVEGPSIEIDINLDIATADGALVESVPGVVSGFSAAAADFLAQVLPSDVQGTMTLTASGDFENPMFGFSAAFNSTSVTGGVQGFAQHIDPNGPSVSAPVGSFTTE
jgi:hypothetical protein